MNNAGKCRIIVFYYFGGGSYDICYESCPFSYLSERKRDSWGSTVYGQSVDAGNYRNAGGVLFEKYADSYRRSRDTRTSGGDSDCRAACVETEQSAEYWSGYDSLHGSDTGVFLEEIYRFQDLNKDLSQFEHNLQVDLSKDNERG